MLKINEKRMWTSVLHMPHSILKCGMLSGVPIYTGYGPKVGKDLGQEFGILSFGNDMEMEQVTPAPQPTWNKY